MASRRNLPWGSLVERVHRSTATRILTAAVLPAFAGLCWLVLWHSLPIFFLLRTLSLQLVSLSAT